MLEVDGAGCSSARWSRSGACPAPGSAWRHRPWPAHRKRPAGLCSTPPRGTACAATTSTRSAPEGSPRTSSCERAADGGRDINGEICFVPDGSGRFLAGEDTGQPSPPPGWGLFEADGTQVGKLTATYLQSGAEPFGCEFAPDGALFTSEVGFQGFGTSQRAAHHVVPALRRVPRAARCVPGHRRAVDELLQARDRPRDRGRGRHRRPGARLRRRVLGAEHRAVLAAVPDRPGRGRWLRRGRLDRGTPGRRRAAGDLRGARPTGC